MQELVLGLQKESPITKGEVKNPQANVMFCPIHVIPRGEELEHIHSKDISADVPKSLY